MKRAIVLSMMLTFAVLLLSCGGPKKLTQDEYQKLSPQERITFLEKYLEKNPNDTQQKKMLYKEYLQAGMEDQAIPVMKDIINLDPNEAEVQFEYGELMWKRGEKQLAYRAYRDALNAPGGDAYLMQIANHLGGKYLIQQLTSGEANEAFPTFSPDGRRVAYQTDENGNWDIVERDLASGETRFLANSAADEELPFYSPDGKKLVFTTNADDRRPIDNKFKVREIYLKEIESDFERNLTETVADDWLPRFNHAGDRIVFTTERSDLRSVPYTEKQSDIYVMESDGDFHLQLTKNESNDGGACFSADDRKIFFHSNRNGSYDIFVMKSDGSLPMTILGDPDVNEVNPFTSPDSLHFVYFSDEGGNYDLYQAKTDGSEIERLTVNPAKDTDGVYSPDGKTIAFQSDRNGNYDIFILNLEATSEPTVNSVLSQLNQLIGE